MRRAYFISGLACLALLVPGAANAASLHVQALPVFISNERVVGAVPSGAQRLTLLHLRLTASCDADVRVSGFTVRDGGRGSTSDIARIYVLRDGIRVSPAATPRRDRTTHVRLRTILIPSCSSIDLVVAGDLSQEAAVASEHEFAIVENSLMTNAGATVSLMAGSGSVIRIVPAASAGGVDVAHLSIPTIHTGRRQRVARLLLSSEKSFNQKIWSIQLTNDGTADGNDLQELQGESSTGERSLVATMDARKVLLAFPDGWTIPAGEERILTVRATVRRLRKTVRLAVEQSSDISAESVRPPRKR